MEDSLVVVLKSVACLSGEICPPNLWLVLNATNSTVNHFESVNLEKLRCGPCPKEVESFSEA